VKRSGRDEPIWVAIHIIKEITDKPWKGNPLPEKYSPKRTCKRVFNENIGVGQQWEITNVSLSIMGVWDRMYFTDSYAAVKTYKYYENTVTWMGYKTL
jgi:hypothetical protein